MELLSCFGAVIAIAFLVLPIVAFFLSISSRTRIKELQAEVAQLHTRIDVLVRTVKSGATMAGPAPAAKEPEDQPAADVAMTDVDAPVGAVPDVAAESEELVPATSPLEPEEVPAAPPAPLEPAIETPPFTSAAAFTAMDRSPQEAIPDAEKIAQSTLDVSPAAAEASSTIKEPSIHEFKPLPPPPAPPPPPSGPPPPSFVDKLRSFDWESLIGVKLFSWIAGIALALAAAFFLKYSVDHGLLSPPIRMALGIATGAGLLIVCELRVARNYRVTANALDAAGVAILYATLFASSSLWKLLPSAVTFVFMILVTVVAVLLSIRRDSVFIALLGLIGGFATPALMSTGQDRPISLFSYLLLLNMGLAWVAYKKKWPALSILTLVFTTIYQWGWVMKFLGEAKLPIAVAVFLVFPLLTVGAFFAASRDPQVSSRRLFGRVTALGAIVPVTFAIYLAAVPAYGSRHHLLFGFLLLIDLGLAVIAATRRAPEGLHTLGALSTVMVLMIWIGVSYGSAAWPAVLGWSAAFVVLYLGFPVAVDRLSRTRPLFRPFDGVGRGAVWAAPFALFVFPVLAGIESRSESPALLFTVLFLLLSAIAWHAVARATPSIYRLASVIAILAEGVWSANHLTEARVLDALLVYGAFAILFIVVPIIARKTQQQKVPGSGVPLVMSLLLLFFLAGGAAANAALVAIAALLVIANAGLFYESRFAGRGWVLMIGLALSWLVLGVWWGTATLVLHLIPALVVLAIFALLISGGSLWLRRSEAPGDRDFNAYMALIGHGFLFVVASKSGLMTHPWPLLAVLALLMLALAAASVMLRQPGLFLANMIATQLVLATLAANGESFSDPYIAIIAALVVAAFAIGWRPLARRMTAEAPDETHMNLGVMAALFLGQLVTIIATQAGDPILHLVLFAHMALLIAILSMSAITTWHVAAVLAIAPAAIATFVYRPSYVPERWMGEMILATLLYLCFICYPLVLGRRIGKSTTPHLTAVLASVPFFFFARTSLEWRGYGDVIGILPVVQGVLLVFLLYRLVRIEPPGERMLGRLALVAGSALAFATVAIPLQLDKEWITIGWAIEAAALIWLYRRIPHRGLLGWATALFVIVFVRLVLNPAVLSYHPRSATPIWNWYLYTYVVSAAAYFAGARLLPSTATGGWTKLRGLLNACGTILLFIVLNIEIADYHSTGPSITFNFSAGLAQDLTYTLGWVIFAIALLVVGLIGRTKAPRMAAIGLLLVSVLKAFLHDLMRLGGLYRVGSLVGLAIALALVAILLQKFVLSTRDTPAEEPKS